MHLTENINYCKKLTTTTTRLNTINLAVNKSAQVFTHVNQKKATVDHKKHKGFEG